MIGQIIQSYLVSLGVQIDKPGFQQADQTIKQTGENIERITGGMAKNFVKASTIIGSAIAGVTASVVGLMKATAQEDLAMQKYARNMMMGEDAAWRMKKATDALGESINDIALTPELLNRFTQLTADGSKMRVGGDFKETMKDFRDLIFEFQRLKQEASYAMNWVGYYLMKYLQKPLADIKAKFKDFNDMVIKNMSVWTAKVAKGIAYVVEAGRRLLQFIIALGGHLKRFWDSFPKGVKIAIAAITMLTAVMRASPLTRMIMALGTIILLIDDYYAHMEGKKSAFGKYWDQLNVYLEKGKVLWEELKTKAEPYWNMIVEYAGKAKEWFFKLAEGAGELKKSFDEWMDSTGSEYLAAFVEECQKLWGILTDIGSVLKETVEDAWKGFTEQLEKNDTIKDITKGLESLWRIIKMLYRAGKDLIKFLVDLWRELEKSQELREFGAAVMELVDAVGELFASIMELVETALKAVFGEFSKTNKVYSFRDAIRAVLKIFIGLAKAVSWVIKQIKDLFTTIKKSKAFETFWKTIGGLIDKAIGKLGKFGRALLALVNSNSISEGLKKAMKVLNADDDVGKKFSKGVKESDDPRVRIAEEVAARTGARADLIYGQMIQEAGWYLSPLAKEHHNYAGIKYYDGAIGYVADERNHQGFNSDEEFIEEYSRVLARDFGPALSAQTPEEWAQALKELDYYKASVEEYTAGVTAGAKAYNDLPDKPQNNDRNDADNPQGAGDSLQRKYFRKWSSAEGMDTPWEHNDVTNTDDFRQTTVDMLNALGKDFYEQFGTTLTITGGAEKGDYHASADDPNAYSHANGYKVDIDDELNGYQRMWLEQWLEKHEAQYGIRYNHEVAKGHYDIVAGHPMAMQTAYTTGKANVVPLGTQIPPLNAAPPILRDDAGRPVPLDDYEDGVLKKISTPQRATAPQQYIKSTAATASANVPTEVQLIVYLQQMVAILSDIQKTIKTVGNIIPQGATGSIGGIIGELGKMAQELPSMIPTDVVGKVAEKLPEIHGCFDELAHLGQELAEKGAPFLEDMKKGFPTEILKGIGGNKSIDIKVDLGGITVNGVKDAEAAANVVFKNAEKEMGLVVGRLLHDNHGLVSF